LLNLGSRGDVSQGSKSGYFQLDTNLAFLFRFPIGHSAWLALAPEIRWLWMQDFVGSTSFESSSNFMGVRVQLDLHKWSLAIWYNRGIAAISGDYTPLNLAGGQVGLNW
ncbi:MAG: hypothetical protein QF464_13950, partial [Myxococcota bacterium]|nr:hypothetical protein [Myxococcota bacterium]